MSIRNKISDNLYELYIGDFPPTIDYEVVRGQFFSFKIIGFNKADDSPFDFDIYDTFNAQIRVEDPRNEKAQYTFNISNPFENLLTDEVVLGEFTLGSGIFDELGLKSAIAFDFPAPWPHVWLDVEGILKEPFGDENLEKHPFFTLDLDVHSDVTRQSP